MKKSLLVVFLALLTMTFSACDQLGTLDDFNAGSNVIPDEDTGEGDIGAINPDNGTNGGNTPEIPEPEDPTPENPDNPQEPVEPNPNPGDNVGEIEEPADKGDKFAGNGSYTDKANPAKLAYYDDINGVPREISNDLVGDLAAGIQFIQTHNIAPSGNSANARPTLVPYRPALLVLTTNTFYKQVKVDIKDNNSNIYRVKMDPPRDIPKVDNTQPNKTPVTFSNKSWTIMIPEKYLVPNMEITFVATDEEGNEYKGILPKENIEYSTPTEVVYFFIRLGMLTEPPAANAGLYMLNEPARAMQEYFQTVPFARVVNATYEPRKLDMVILGNGTIYDVNGERGNPVSSSNGGYYDGDMRGAVAKYQYSAAINLANRGVSSSAINEGTDDHQREKDPLYMAVHHAQGKYANGVQRHGLSGGAGMFTLVDSKGNEFSHELGHGYGLGHYVDGGWTTTGVIHSFDTGWGYDSYKNVIRGSLSWGTNGAGSQSYGGRTVPSFNNKYNWNKDTMSGGWAESSISQYTHLTARTMMKVQDYAKNRYKLSDEKIDGKYRYQYWDNNEKTYKLVTEEMNAGFLSVRRPATERGVPVITILGGYNPTNINQAVVYPYFRGNYGHVFGDLFLNEPPSSGTYLKIEYHGTDAVKYVELSDTVFNGSQVNKMHVNIPESSKPKKVTLYIRNNTKTDVKGYYTEIPETLEPMNPAVIIGKDYGYKAVIQSDINEINKSLANMTVDNYQISTRNAEIISNLKYNDSYDMLSGNVKAITDAYLAKMEMYDNITTYINTYGDDIRNGNTEALAGIRAMLEPFGYKPGGYVAEEIRINNGSCLEVRENNGKKYAYKATCNSQNNQKWFMDEYKRIRPASHPGLCLRSDLDTYGLVPCEKGDSFFWTEESTNDNKFIYKNNATNQCLDMANDGRGYLITYECNSGANQKFNKAFSKEKIVRYNADAVNFTNNNKCIFVNSNKKAVTKTCDRNDTDNMSIRWFMDSDKKIHSAQYPNYCLDGSRLEQGLSLCSDSNKLRWNEHDRNGKTYYENVNWSNQCLDEKNGSALNLWQCNFNNKPNQLFNSKFAREENKAIAVLPGSLLEQLDELLENMW